MTPEELERIIDDFETKRDIALKNGDYVSANAYEYAADRLKQVAA